MEFKITAYDENNIPLAQGLVEVEIRYGHFWPKYGHTTVDIIREGQITRIALDEFNLDDLKIKGSISYACVGDTVTFYWDGPIIYLKK